MAQQASDQMTKDLFPYVPSFLHAPLNVSPTPKWASRNPHQLEWRPWPKDRQSIGAQRTEYDWYQCCKPGTRCQQTEYVSSRPAQVANLKAQAIFDRQMQEHKNEVYPDQWVIPISTSVRNYNDYVDEQYRQKTE